MPAKAIWAWKGQGAPPNLTIRCASISGATGFASLLTREGEVEIAERIEEGGERGALHPAGICPLTFKEIMGPANRLEEAKLSPQDSLEDHLGKMILPWTNPPISPWS